MPKLSYRYLQAVPADLDETAAGERTLAVAFSSETPVLRQDKDGTEFYEVLSHDPADADISLLQNSGAFLDEHDRHRQIGSVQRAWIDRKDRKGRALLTFAPTRLGDERYRLMQGGFRRDVSFGYLLSKTLSTTRGADGKPIRRFAWRAFEISSVSVGADRGETGVGRSHNFQTQTQSQNFMTKTINHDEINVTEMTAIERHLLHDHPHLEQQIKQIHARALLEDMTLGEYKRSMKELITKNPKTREFYSGDRRFTSATAPAVDPAIDHYRAINHEVGMDPADIRSYSFVRAIRSAIENGGRPKDCFECDVNQQVEKTCGKRSEGFYVPSDIILGGTRRDFQKRDLFTGDFGSGGALVNPQMPMSVIEILRNRAVCTRLGCTMLGGLQGPVVLPRQTGTATAQAIAEIAALADSQLNLDQITLRPKRVGATTTYSRQLVFQSTPGVEAVVRDDLFQVVALLHDNLLINGTGSNSQPLGILNTPGINAVDFGGSATFAKVVAFETALGKLNADLGNMAYATTPNTKGVWKSTAVALTGATTVSSRSIWEDGNWSDGSNDGRVNGYRAASSNQIANDIVLFGRWSELIYAMWGGFEIIIDPYTKAKNAEIVTTINSWLDAGLRHGQSFTVSSDSGAQ